MDKILAVMRREFIERVRTRAFIIGTIIVPVMMFGFGYLPALLMQRETRARTLVLVDGTADASGGPVEAALAALTLRAGDGTLPRYRVTRIVTGPEVAATRDSLIGRIGLAESAEPGPDGVLVLTEASIEQGKVSYFGSNVASFSDMRAMDRAIEPVLRAHRLARIGADPATVAAAGVTLDLETNKVTGGRVTGESGESSFLLAYITAFVMYLSLIMYGIQVMGAVLEEKSNRIVEVLISSITPFQLLLGKVVGVAGAGLLQLAIWGGASFFVSTRLAASRGGGAADQVAMDGTQRSFNMPNISLELIVIILLFFLLGFLLYSALYAAVGAMCSTQQETQQAAQPVTILLAVGFITMFSMINDPSSGLAVTLSFIPFFAPLVMPVRYALSPLPLVEVAGSLAATALGVVAVVWLAARIYRVGILSYGKRPTVAEMWRWVRTG